MPRQAAGEEEDDPDPEMPSPEMPELQLSRCSSGGGGGGGTKNLTRSTSFAIRKNKLNTVKEKTPSCILGRRADICVW